MEDIKLSNLLLQQVYHIISLPPTIANLATWTLAARFESCIAAKERARWKTRKKSI